MSIAPHDYGSIQPSPAFILRAHAAQINALSFSRDGRFLASGDSDGFVCVWTLQTFRPLLFWRAHAESVLTLHEWGHHLVTHGRDNVIHVFDVPTSLPALSGATPGTAPSPSRPSTLSPRYSLPTNALAYCKAAFLALSERESLIATPAVLSDELVDVCHLPSCKRVSRSVGHGAWPLNDKTGTVMALELFRQAGELILLVAYEDGRLACFVTSWSDRFDVPRMEEAEGWRLRWHQKGHREPIMSLATSPDRVTAWTVAADHFVSSYALSGGEDESSTPRWKQHDTKQAGRACISVRDDGTILAIAGWDGMIRVHSTKTFKPLAVLDFHRDSVFVVAFAPTTSAGPVTSDDVERTAADGHAHHRPKTWLAAAGKDQRISMWELYPLATTA